MSFGLSPGAASLSLSPSSSVKVGTPGLSLGSSSSSSSFAVGDPAPLFTESCLPVHGERRADWYLYTMTETETSRIPSPNSTIAMSPTSRYPIRCWINYIQNFHIIHCDVGTIAREWPPEFTLDLRVVGVKIFSPLTRGSGKFRGSMSIHIDFSCHDHPNCSSLYAVIQFCTYTFNHLARPPPSPTSAAPLHHTTTTFPPHFRSQDFRRRAGGRTTRAVGFCARQSLLFRSLTMGAGTQQPRMSSK